MNEDEDFMTIQAQIIKSDKMELNNSKASKYGMN